MEKTTKKKEKPNDIKYGIPKQKDVNTLFGKQDARPGDDMGPEMPSIAECVAEANALGGVYAIHDPIDTVVGPIGRFQAVPEGLPRHPAIVGFGKRRTGKTFTTRDLFFHCLMWIQFGIVITRTKMNGFWQTYVPPAFVFGAEMMSHVISILIKRQIKKIEKWKKEHPNECAESPDAYKEVDELAAFVILDDVIADAAAMLWNTQLTSLFVEGRHLCITVVILTQYPKGVGPKIRGNADLAILQPIYDHDQVDMLANMYNGGLDRNLWKRLMNQIVKDELQPGSTPLQSKKEVRTMFVSDFENTKNPQIKFHYYEAEDPGKFRLCAPEYWKAQEELLRAPNKGSYRDPVDVLDEVRAGLN